MRDVDKLRLRVRELEKQNENLSKILINTQPVLGRLLAVAVVLEQIGIINNDQLNKVQEQQAEAFIATANQKSSQEVRSESGQAGTVVGDTGNSRRKLPRVTSVGGTPESDNFLKDRQRTVLP